MIDIMNVPPAWRTALKEQLRDPRLEKLAAHLAERSAAGAEIYPPQEQIYSALKILAPQDVKVVLVGQDPYHNPGQAHGLSFSVPEGVVIPPSLANIHKELISDIGAPVPSHGSLVKWAEQGVLLLNALLTVERSTPLAHKGKGWDVLTDGIIRHLADSDIPKVFMLWGGHAHKKGSNVDEEKHLVIRSVHPSPLSAHRGFFGSRPFSRANAFLKEHERQEIDWRL